MTTTVAEACARAVQLGQEIAVLRADGAGRRFTRARWLELACQLAGVRAVKDLEALRAKVAERRWLLRLCRLVAQAWVEGGHDIPGVVQDFDQPDRYPAEFAERLAQGLSPEQCSGVVALLAAELVDEQGRAGWWGTSTRGPGAEQAERLAEITAELEVLDRQLLADIRLSDLTSGPSGMGLSLGGHGMVPLSVGVDRLASGIAELLSAQALHRLAA